MRSLGAFLANYTEIQLTFIACEGSKPGMGGGGGGGGCQYLEPMNYEDGDGSYVLSGGSMLYGCHPKSGESQSINPTHYGDHVGIV